MILFPRLKSIYLFHYPLQLYTSHPLVESHWELRFSLRAIAEKAKVIDVCLFLLGFWQRCAGCIFIMTVIFADTFVCFSPNRSFSQSLVNQVKEVAGFPLSVWLTCLLTCYLTACLSCLAGLLVMPTWLSNWHWQQFAQTLCVWLSHSSTWTCARPSDLVPYVSFHLRISTRYTHSKTLTRPYT